METSGKTCRENAKLRVVEIGADPTFVVLAKARTHYPECELLCDAVATMPFTTEFGGYESWLSPGRRGESFRKPPPFSSYPPFAIPQKHSMVPRSPASAGINHSLISRAW